MRWLNGIADSVNMILGEFWEMATYSNTFIWENPWIEEPGSLQSMGSQVRHHLVDMNLVTKQQEQRLVVWSLSPCPTL